jgi:3-hydroxyacyl-CoA dehydrogenase/enoyl-CoA hydratase/3-hydroxybutyryl-CoA epimerase
MMGGLEGEANMAIFQTSNLKVEERPDGIALLRLDVAGRNVNVLNRQVLADIDQALETTAADHRIRVLVIRSDKSAGFVAGADLQEFASVRAPEDATQISVAGQNLFNKVADLPIPTVAMIHGPCLGGGLELALACDYRLVVDSPKTQLGFPEVELGLIPGWGGTQRLPRVVGLERALQLIVGARRLKAREAERWGLADGVAATEEQLSAQLNLLIDRALVQGKRPKEGLPLATWRQRLLESNPIGRFLLFRGTERILRRRVPEDMPAPWEAVRLLRTGIGQGLHEGLAREREASLRLASTAACRNLVTLFLHIEQARKLSDKLTEGAGPPIRTVGVVGAGAMGAGIAQLAALRGFQVVVQEIDQTALSAGVERISALFEKAVEKKLLTNDAARKASAGIRYSTTWEGFGDVDLVVEAIVEDLQAKQAVFRELEQRTNPTAILGTNTSSLLVKQLQQGRQHPERVAGLHFFNPVHKMPLVEVVRAPSTNNQVVGRLMQWSAALGKTPVEVVDSPGFVVNRILMPYTYEAVLLAATGVPVETIDQTMRQFGMPMGPLELLDQVGVDVAAHIARAMQPLFAERLGSYPEQEGLSRSFERMRQNGWLGQKAGLGFYNYRGKVKTVHRAALKTLEEDVAAPASDAIRDLSRSIQLRESRERLVLAMVNEAAACLGDRLAADADTIDLAMVLGTGWAPHRGGPLRYAQDRGLDDVLRKLEDMAKRLGPRFAPCSALREWAGKQ